MNQTFDKIQSWFPVAIWFAFISCLSSIPGSTLSSVPPIILNLLKIPLDVYLFWGHRTAHLVEYGILGALTIRAYARQNISITVRTILFLSYFIFLGGILDEWHQSFVPGRTPELIDAIFDTICGALGMVLYKLFLYRRQ